MKLGELAKAAYNGYNSSYRIHFIEVDSNDPKARELMDIHNSIMGSYRLYPNTLKRILDEHPEYGELEVTTIGMYGKDGLYIEI